MVQKQSAEVKTITRLFAVYLRQGITKKHAVRLIAASLSLTQKDVDDALREDRSLD